MDRSDIVFEIIVCITAISFMFMFGAIAYVERGTWWVTLFGASGVFMHGYLLYHSINNLVQEARPKKTQLGKVLIRKLDESTKFEGEK